MGRFENTENGVVVVVDDSKDERFTSALWKSVDAENDEKKASARRSPSKSED